MSSTVYRSAGGVVDAMNRVYLNMFLAVLTSMAVGSWVGNDPELFKMFFGGWQAWIILLAPLAMIFVIPAALASGISRLGGQLLLHAFAAMMGLSLAGAFAIYTIGSITTAFMGAAVLFGTLSFYGYFTKQDLTELGQYLFIALIALIIVMIINLFLGSTLLNTAISAVAVLVFLGLTAYDTQKIREMVTEDGNDNAELMGALTLYLDFLNLFVHILQLIGVKKD